MASSILWEEIYKIEVDKRQRHIERACSQQGIEILQQFQAKIAEQDFEWFKAHESVNTLIVRCFLFGYMHSTKEYAVEVLTDLIQWLEHPYNEDWLNLLTYALEINDRHVTDSFSEAVKRNIRECRHRPRRSRDDGMNGGSNGSSNSDDGGRKDDDDPSTTLRRLLEEAPKAMQAARADYLRTLANSIAHLIGNPSHKFPFQHVENALSVIAYYEPSRALADFYLQLAKAYMYHSIIGRAITTADKSYQLFKTVNDHHGMCISSFVKADAFVQRRNHQNADVALQTALYHQSFVDNISMPGEAYTRGSLCYYHKRYQDSAYWYEFALKQYAMHPDYQNTRKGIQARATCLQAMGLAHIFTDEYEKSEKEVEEAHELFKELELHYQVAHTRLQRGNLEFRRGNDELGHEFMSEAIELSKAIDDKMSRENLLDEIRIILQDIALRGKKA